MLNLPECVCLCFVYRKTLSHEFLKDSDENICLPRGLQSMISIILVQCSYLWATGDPRLCVCVCVCVHLHAWNICTCVWKCVSMCLHASSLWLVFSKNRPRAYLTHQTKHPTQSVTQYTNFFRMCPRITLPSTKDMSVVEETGKITSTYFWQMLGWLTVTCEKHVNCGLFYRWTILPAVTIPEDLANWQRALK